MTEVRDGMLVAQCAICLLSGQKMFPPVTRTFELICERCGRFKYTQEARHPLAGLGPGERARVAEWIWQQNQQSTVPLIRQADVPMLAERPSLPFADRARRLLAFLARDTQFPGTNVEYRQLALEAMLQTLGPRGVELTIEHLAAEGLVQKVSTNAVILTGKGLMQAQEWARIVTASRQGFVAMWFDTTMAEAWSIGLEPAIRAAGYSPMRIDMKEHANKICDEIIAEIRRSRFLVADYTGQRGGVYYEAGFAAGLATPVILTCRKDEMEKLHFDIRQFNCIDWQTPAELASRLQSRIEAVIGEGPLKERA
jgi:hypothetical protein